MKDASGAAVARADVSIVNQDTNIGATAKSSDAGQFVVDNLAKGLKVGMGASDASGTIGLGTFGPRQATGRLLLRF